MITTTIPQVNRNKPNPFPVSSIKQTLKSCQERVERALESCLPAADAPPTRLHQAMRYAILNGGKRIRAALVYAAGAAAGADDATLDAPACAVELIHSYSLIHDDLPCMDDDDLRRGRPTCHKAYDEATALLAGDALQALAFEILAHDATMPVGAAQRLKMMETLAQAIGSRGMAGGQAIDLESVGEKLSLPQLEDCYLRKTGALIRAAVLLGALTREDVDHRLLAALNEYGRTIGLAFQITDDILDVEGEIEKLGKTPGADQARNKPTYPALLGLNEAKARARALHASTLETLKPLGDNGAFLADLAGYIIKRIQ
ncbi:MAG: polyprenyl synthetase family protein [Gammaproteobacteria bacterium]|nr:MAG: polyprenyl synthetase family protein [Gammaproteobacteria bacterium]